MAIIDDYRPNQAVAEWQPNVNSLTFQLEGKTFCPDLIPNRQGKKVPSKEWLPIDLQRPLAVGERYDILAEIDAGLYPMLLIDIRKTAVQQNHQGRYRRYPFVGFGGIAADVDFLLVDANFDGQNDWGYKGLREGETIEFGANISEKGRFNPNDTVSGKHFILHCNEAGQPYILDQHSKNGTYLVQNSQIFEPAAASTDQLIPTTPSEQVAPEEQLTPEVEKNQSPYAIATAKFKGEDRFLANEQYGLYGVFDGAGGHYGGELAAETATWQAHWMIEELLLVDPAAPPQKRAEYMKRSLEFINQALIRDPDCGITTGTIAHVFEFEGVQYLAWASVGDSRLYSFDRQTNTLGQFSTDEGFGRNLYNALGTQECEVEQGGVMAIPEPGRYQFILCTDGITGNYEHDMLSNGEILDIMIDNPNPQDAANELLTKSRKVEDDKTVIVLQA